MKEIYSEYSPIFVRTCKAFMFIVLFVFMSMPAFAHEAYVEPRKYFWHIMHSPIDPRVFDALRNPHNVYITVSVVIGVSIFYLLNFLFRRSRPGQKLHHWFEQFALFGPLFVRAAIVASFFISAMSGSFLGPELRLDAFPAVALMKGLLYASSVLIFFGFLTELAAAMALVAFTAGFFVFHSYMFTYLNYLGEIIVLLLFGMRSWSVDRIIFGKLHGLRERFEPYETTIVRIFYGLALVYAAITVKFLHPDITVNVAETWHLTQFHWLFPSDPWLLTMGAGLVETAIGLFIIVGFEMRTTVLISLIYITLSLLYFREIVWPHLMLYGISLNLLIQPEVFTLDHLLFDKYKAPWWKRPFQKHRKSKRDSEE